MDLAYISVIMYVIGHGQSTPQIVHLSVTRSVLIVQSRLDTPNELWDSSFRVYKKQQSKGSLTFGSRSLSVRICGFRSLNVSIILHLGVASGNLDTKVAALAKICSVCD